MKILTKCVDFENEKFVLFKDKKAGLPEYYKNGEYYGTIPYTELDESGKLKRQLNGFEIGIENSAEAALRYRWTQIQLKKFEKEHPEASEETLIKKAIELSNAIK